jgi:hypothetical protein
VSWDVVGLYGSAWFPSLHDGFLLSTHGPMISHEKSASECAAAKGCWCVWSQSRGRLCVELEQMFVCNKKITHHRIHSITSSSEKLATRRGCIRDAPYTAERVTWRLGGHLHKHTTCATMTRCQSEINLRMLPSGNLGKAYLWIVN